MHAPAQTNAVERKKSGDGRWADAKCVGYQPLANETRDQKPEEGEFEPEQAETEEDSVILRGDSIPIVHWNKFNTEGKKAH